MHQPRIVDRGQPGQQLRGDLAGRCQIQGAVLRQLMDQRAPVDVLHRYQLLIVRQLQIEDPADVGRNHFAGRQYLAPHELHDALICQQFPAHRLERHLHPKLEVKGLPYLAHATVTQQGPDPVAITQPPGRQKIPAPWRRPRPPAGAVPGPAC